MGLRTGDPQRRAYQGEERLDLRLRPRRKIDGMNIPGAKGFCGAKPDGAKCFSPRMSANEHEYYLRSRMLFGCHFLASIREDSRSCVAKILFLDLYKHLDPPGAASDWW